MVNFLLRSLPNLPDESFQFFSQRSQLGDKLAATDGKSLAEAGQSDSFAIGMPLNHRDIFDTTKWKKNLLGKMLMNIRQELLI